MASMPRWPFPRGSNDDTPIGSSTTASSAKSASQPSRSPLSTAVTDRTDMSRAGCGGYLSIPSMTVFLLLEDLVAVAAEEETVAAGFVGAGHPGRLAGAHNRSLPRALPVIEHGRRRIERRITRAHELGFGGAGDLDARTPVQVAARRFRWRRP